MKRFFIFLTFCFVFDHLNSTFALTIEKSDFVGTRLKNELGLEFESRRKNGPGRKFRRNDSNSNNINNNSGSIFKKLTDFFEIPLVIQVTQKPQSQQQQQQQQQQPLPREQRFFG